MPLSVCYKVLYYYDVMINEVTRDMGWAKHGLVQTPSIHLAGHLTTSFLVQGQLNIRVAERVESPASASWTGEC